MPNYVLINHRRAINECLNRFVQFSPARTTNRHRNVPFRLFSVRLLTNGARTHKKGSSHGHYAAHLFAGVDHAQQPAPASASDSGHLNSDPRYALDFNLDSAHGGASAFGGGDKLRDKSIKYATGAAGAGAAAGRGHGHGHGTTDGSLSDTPYTSYWNKYAHSAKNPSGESPAISHPVSCNLKHIIVLKHATIVIVANIFMAFFLVFYW